MRKLMLDGRRALVTGSVQRIGYGRVASIHKPPSLRTSMPGEIARLVVWLCEPAAHNLTGTAIPVDGAIKRVGSPQSQKNQ